MPQLLGWNCLHAPPPHRLAARKSKRPLQPRAQQPRPTARSIISALPAFATTRSHRSCRRRTQRTVEVKRRQLRHPCETRCQRRCPTISDQIACTHRRPIGSPLANPNTGNSPTRNRPSPQHAGSSLAQCRRSQPSAHSAAAADASSVRLRFSDVSCVIPPRLGASDAAPASMIPLSARTAAPSNRRSQTPPPATAPSATAPAQQHAASSAHCRRSQPPAHIAAAADARSVPRRSSVVSCGILPRLGASNATPSSPISPLSARTAAARLAHRKLHNPLQPGALPPRPTARRISSALPAFATARSQRSCRRCTQRTTEVQCRQLRHPCQTRCQQPRPSCSDPSACTHRRPIGSPLASPTTRYSPASDRLGQQHAASSAHCRRPQPPAHSAAAANASSVRVRYSDVSCVILPRLGASAVAPSSPICPFSARTAAPSARRSQAPQSVTAPRATAAAHSTQHHQRLAGVRNHPLTAQLQSMHAAYG